MSAKYFYEIANNFKRSAIYSVNNPDHIVNFKLLPEYHLLAFVLYCIYVSS